MSVTYIYKNTESLCIFDDGKVLRDALISTTLGRGVSIVVYIKSPRAQPPRITQELYNCPRAVSVYRYDKKC